MTLDAPLHRDITRWHSDLCAFLLLEQVGVCDLRIAGQWGGFFIHHKNGEHDNGWDQIKVHHVAYGLVANVTCESTTSAVGLANCLGCVAGDCRIEGNLGHNGFVLSKSSTGNMQPAARYAGHNMHGFNVQGLLSGNALIDCSMDEPSGIDLHGGIGCDTLVDNMSGGVLKGGGGRARCPTPWPRLYPVELAHRPLRPLQNLAAFGCFRQPRSNPRLYRDWHARGLWPTSPA